MVCETGMDDDSQPQPATCKLCPTGASIVTTRAVVEPTQNGSIYCVCGMTADPELSATLTLHLP